MNIELGNRNIEFFQNFEDEVGEPLEFRETGYMYLFHSEEKENEWRDLADFYEDHDVNAEVLAPDEATDVFSPLDASQIRGALYAPDCGHVDPHMLTQAFGKAAVDCGATIHTKTAVTDITVEDGSVSTIESERGTYEVDAVLNAAGPWASRVGDMVDVSIPLDLMVCRIMVTSQIDDANSPLIIDPEWECYFESEKNGSLLVCDMEQDIHDIDNPDTAVSGDSSYEYYLEATEKVSQLVPQLTELEVINGWGGIQSHSPDGHAILGATDVPGFFLACGFSGHGVQQSPSVGAAMADLLVDGHTDVFDVDHLSLERFEHGDGIAPEDMA
jgi:sarcosine oxidase subunit beta